MCKMLLIRQDFEPFTSAWNVWSGYGTYHEEGRLLPLGWEEELTQRGIEFEEVEIIETDTEIEITIEKLYFSSKEERDAFNSAEAEYAGKDPSIPYLEVGKDESGYYLLVDVIAKPSLWQRFKNLF